VRVVYTVQAPSSFILENFGLDMSFQVFDDMEPEDLLSFLMRPVVFERRLGVAGYPLIEESMLALLTEY